MAKKRSSGSSLIGRWAFLIGVVLAIILGAGFIDTSTTMTTVLVVIGLIIGLLNITGDEAHGFIISAVVLIIAASFGQDVLGTIGILAGTLNALLAIFVPATIIVAIRHVFSVAGS